MKFLIVGLGNIGPEYIFTRHNIGFLAADRFAEKIQVSFKSDRFGDVAKGTLKGKQITLLKPNTYMNLSGKAVKFWMQQLQIPIEQVLVIVDDLALPFGTLRVRSSGSDAGHNGLKSMQAELGTSAYPRLRFGIGNDFAKGRQVEYVLGKWTAEQEATLPAKLDKCADIIQSFCLAGIQITMNQFNNQS